MLRFSYERKVPLQMLLTHGYDDAMNESKCKSCLGEVPVMYCFYESIDPLLFDTCDAFVEEVNQLYKARYLELTQAYAALKTDNKPATAALVSEVPSSR
jgi:hypothetical protein